MKNLFLALAVCLCPVTSYGWSGTDVYTGESVEIGQGNLVRRGLDIDVYDYQDGSYRTMSVENIRRYGNSVELEVYDWQQGEYRTFDMYGR